MTFLPQPSAVAQAHSERLRQLIFERIHANNDWISFAEFMQRALYEPGLGYYVSGSRKLGQEGDFITAPETSSAFSQCLALQCQQILEQISGGSIMEFGAGSGIMAADILLALEEREALPKKYYILEVSPDFQERQQMLFQKKCTHLLSLVEWVSKIPVDFEGVVLANEVLDAMPVHCFEIQNEKMYERGVIVSDEKFVWETKKNVVFDVGAVPCACPLENGYSSEICLAIKPWLQTLYAAMKRGVVLLIDYGFPEQEYYHPDRHQGTLMCHYRHHAHADPFVFLGLQDITAHVDFTGVARAAIEAGFSVTGYTNQASFLMALGILTNTDISILNGKQQYSHAQAIKKLLLPSEMGELFKIIALNKKVNIPLQGFSLRNDLRRVSI